MKKFIALVIIVFGSCSLVRPQVVYHHVSNKSIYSFLDEMANAGIIQLTSVVKPYSREYIAYQLDVAKSNREQLNRRQQKSLDFYLRDFNKELLPGKDYRKRLDLFYYKDSSFTLSVNPILGFQFWSNQNENFYHRWNGAEAFAYMGDHLGVYASLRDNHENIRLSDPAYLNDRGGANYKAQYDFSEMRGGITWSWKWGTVGLVKDHFEWGNHYHYPNIFSARPPSMAHLKLNLKPVHWFEFNYIHAWMVSEVIDSSRSYWYTNNYGTFYREVFQPKYLSANLFTFRPVKKMHVSLGNSVIYSDMGLHPAYIIPVFFYKSVDHTLNSTGPNQRGQNSHMFIDLSVRNLKNVHLYSTLFIDELAVSRFTNDTAHNFVSYRYGLQFSNIIPNTFLTLEYTKTLPLVYKHDMPTTTFESNLYNLGHYMQDNSRELHVAFGLKPFRGFNFKFHYTFAQRGKDHTSLGTYRVGNPFLDTVEWEKRSLGMDISYQVINDGFVFVGFTHREISGDKMEIYTAPVYHGTTNTFSLGVNVGF